jgi:hypothetical protein
MARFLSLRPKRRLQHKLWIWQWITFYTMFIHWFQSGDPARVIPNLDHLPIRQLNSFFDCRLIIETLEDPRRFPHMVVFVEEIKSIVRHRPLLGVAAPIMLARKLNSSCGECKGRYRTVSQVFGSQKFKPHRGRTCSRATPPRHRFASRMGRS